VTVQQRLSYVTLGARSMTAQRAFYARLGWSERPGSDDQFTTYQLGPIILALYPLALLSAEAAPGEEPPQPSWNGVTLGINVESKSAVDTAFESALVAGATAIARPVQRDWGGYSGYLADPEGNRWEITWAPNS
jgi:uncharacterized glyoxalase superfamily protein PhnB